jgi:HD-like signal output (HDOD) protein
LVSYDKSIAAQCVRLSNSPLFGRSQNVETIRDAVMALGLWRVRDIVFSFTIPRLFESNANGIESDIFWRHSLACAMVSHRFARMIRFGSADKAYLAGLLHDLGLLVNSVAFPKEFPLALDRARTAEMPLYDAEREILGLSHCETGRILANAWHLSEDIATVVEYHHDPEAAPLAKELTALVHLSDELCRLRGLGYGYYESAQIEFAGESSWSILRKSCPQLDHFDLVRFTFDLDDYAEQVRNMVTSIFGA